MKISNKIMNYIEIIEFIHSWWIQKEYTPKIYHCN